MYQLHHDIFEKIGIYVSVIRQFKESVDHVRVFNEIKDHFGKRYSRVHIEIKLKEGENKDYELDLALREAFWKRFIETHYFSFHIRSNAVYAEDDSIFNKEEEIHYDYIWNFLEWLLKRDDIKVIADRFLSEYDIREEAKKRWKEIETQTVKEDVAVSSVTIAEGQLIAVKNYGNLRIGFVEKVVMPTKKQSFSIKLIEVLKNLIPGQREIYFWSKRELYAVIQPDQLPKGLTKPKLIEILEKNEAVEGIVWRRPQELWK